MKEVPFTCSRDAARMIFRAIEPLPDTDPAIVVSMGMKVGHADDLVARFDGMHFVLGRYPKGQRPADSFFFFRGRAVSIMPTTLEHLSGKHLILTKPDWTKRKWFVRKQILRAETATATERVSRSPVEQ
jgi:hypothetical protein